MPCAYKIHALFAFRRERIRPLKLGKTNGFSQKAALFGERTERISFPKTKNQTYFRLFFRVSRREGKNSSFRSFSAYSAHETGKYDRKISYDESEDYRFSEPSDARSRKVHRRDIKNRFARRADDGGASPDIRIRPVPRQTS